MKLVECVPNFSEGRDLSIIESITDEIKRVEGVELLDVDPGEATNRTVVTLVGTPEGAADAAFRAVARASELIDMSKHHGAHARMGATDVCPFVPVTGVTMDDCVELANKVARRIAEELKIPTYLYEHAARTPERQNLATVRKGEYEGLEQKFRDPQWKPDYGEPVFNAKSGATAVGAREFLIAYNVNLNSRDRKQAMDVALDIREAGRNKRDANGKFVRDDKGVPIKVPGPLMLKNCKAVGWYIDEYEIAQISINLTNHNITAPHQAFEACREGARNRGMRVTGSEIVGLIPRDALLMAAKYYLEKAGKTAGLPEKELIQIAVQSLGLNDVAKFDPAEKIIEYRVKSATPRLVDRTISRFVDETSLDSPAPGGGSVAALCGSLSAALSSMVANLTHAHKNYRGAREEMDQLALKAQKIKAEFLEDIDRDTDAFNAVMDAMRLPKETDDEITARDLAILEANKDATRIPLGVLRRCIDAMEISLALVSRGFSNSLSDAGVAGLAGTAAADGAYYNVRINLLGMTDEKFVSETLKEADTVRERVHVLDQEIRRVVEKGLA